MIRKTSVDTFHQIRDEGLLSKMRFQCYELLYEYGPMTANQLMAKARELNPKRSHQAIESIGRRLSELVRQEVAIELKEGVRCPVTGRPVILWATTDNLPVALKAPKADKIKCTYCKGRGYLRQGRLF